MVSLAALTGHSNTCLMACSFIEGLKSRQVQILITLSRTHSSKIPTLIVL